MNAMKKPLGYILYEGPSVLDGAPIVAIATGIGRRSKNAKTGDMVQTWIIRSDMHPSEALSAKHDASVCGNCPHRQSTGGDCYVDVGKAPGAVYRAFKAGRYSRVAPQPFAGRLVRLGAYGDPAAVPSWVWASALIGARGWTGYTHQARHANFDRRILQWCMVSADTERQARAYHMQGFRTFRVKRQGDPVLAGEVVCPSMHGITCAECGMCNGQWNDKPNVCIDLHGNYVKHEPHIIAKVA
jgi:hypothetical protein